MLVAILLSVFIIAVWVALLKQEKVKESKLVKSIINTIGIILLCEILVFNSGVFRMAFNKAEEYQLPFENAEITNMTNKNGKLCAENKGEHTVEFKNIGRPAETIYLDVSSSNIITNNIEIFYTDETAKNLNEGRKCKMAYIANNEQSQYIACSFSGDVGSLKFIFNLEKDEKLVINSVSINKRIPLHISPIRILFLMLLILPVVAVMNCKKRDEKVDFSLFKRICIVSGIFFAAIPILICFYQSESIVKDFENPTYNQINYELVNAFKSGKVELEKVPSEQLAKLENPYDKTQRNEVDTEWDHVYYNGKYYSYYGIGPVLLLFLPYNLITGNYFPSLWACGIFGSIGLVFLTMTYYAFIKRFFPTVSNALAVFGLFIAQITSEIWYNVTVDNFYEIAETSAFAAITAGAYFLIESNAVGDGEISKKHACISSILLSLGVLCRPTVAMYCIAALLFIFFGAKKLWQKKSESKNELIKYLCATLIPFVVIGSVQMIYNALRFGSPFEFGIKYSLTISDFTKSQFHWTFVLAAFYNYLLAVPVIQPVPPYVSENFDTLGVNGFYYYNSLFSTGFTFKALPVFGYALAGKAWRYGGKNRKAALLTLSACVLAPLVIIFSTWESGYATRYAVDFSWQLLFGAYVILFTIYKSLNLAEMKKLMTKFFAASCIVAAVTITSMSIKYIFYANQILERKAEILSFIRLFDFLNIF